MFGMDGSDDIDGGDGVDVAIFEKPIESYKLYYHNGTWTFVDIENGDQDKVKNTEYAFINTSHSPSIDGALARIQKFKTDPKAEVDVIDLRPHLYLDFENSIQERFKVVHKIINGEPDDLDFANFKVDSSHPAMALANFTPAQQDELVKEVQKVFDQSKLGIVVVKDKPIEQNYHSIRFSSESVAYEGIQKDASGNTVLDPNGNPVHIIARLNGQAYQGIDTFNKKDDDVTAVFMDPNATQLSGSKDAISAIAHTVAHEFGHSLGVRHVNPIPNSGIEVEDYQPYAGIETFTNSVSQILEPPDNSGKNLDPNAGTHNPIYHISHYFLGRDKNDLIDRHIMPGSYDTMSYKTYVYNIVFSSLSQSLENVSISYKTDFSALLTGAEEYSSLKVLAQSLQAGETLSFEVPQGQTFQLVGSTSDENNIDFFVDFSGNLGIPTEVSSGSAVSSDGVIFQSSNGHQPVQIGAVKVLSVQEEVLKSGDEPSANAPVATNDTVNATAGQTKVINAATLLANDTDADGNPLSITGVSGASHGTVIYDAGTQKVTFTPDAGYTGPASFDYSISDGQGGTSQANVAVTVTAPVNNAPVGVSDSYTTNEDTGLTIAATTGVLANDTDADGNLLTATVVSGPAHGALTLNANGSFTYTPNVNYNGSDSFTYKANDGTDDSTVATVSLTVSAVNDAPVGVNDSDTAVAGQAKVIAATTLLANDTDADGNALSITGVSGASHGAAAFDALTNTVTFTPDAGYAGAASFSYAISDGQGGTAQADVNINVSAPMPTNNAPISVNDSYSTSVNTALTIAAAAGVLANDTDADNNPLTATLVAGPSHGALTLNMDGSLAYTPDVNYTGADSFTYKANDGTDDSNVATVSLTVSPAAPVNTAPVGVNDSVNATAGQTKIIDAATLLANDTDADGNALSITGVSGASHGNVSYDAGTQKVTFTPDAGYTGLASFDYALSDGQGGSGQASVAVTVTAATPPGSVGITLSPTSAGQLPAGVTPIGGLVLDLIGVNGVRVVSQVSAADLYQGYFSTNPGQIGTQSGFDSTVINALGGGIAEVAVRVTLYDGDTAAGNFDYNANSLLLNGIEFGNFSSVLTQETSSDGKTIFLSELGFQNDALNTGWFYSKNASTLSQLYTSLSTAHQVVYGLNDTSDVGDNFFDFTRGLSGGLINVGQPPIITPPANQAPVGVNDTYSTDQGVALTIQAAAGVLANDTDADGNPLTAAVVAGPAHGALALNADGSFSYTPDANYSGADSFSYKANDGTADSAATTVSLTINAPAPSGGGGGGGGPIIAPTAVDDVYQAAAGTPLVVAKNGVLGNDNLGELVSLTVAAVNGSSAGVGQSVAGLYGHLVLNTDGSFTYTADNLSAAPTGQSLTEHFTYDLPDKRGDGTANLDIQINRAPVVETTNIDLATATPTDNISGVLATAFDPDGNPLTVAGVQGLSTNVGHSVVGQYGTLILNANGTYTYEYDNSNLPVRSEVHDVFSFSVSDGHGGLTSSTLDIAVPGPTTTPEHPLFGSVSHGTDSAGGQVVALYDAIFDRAPDPLGLEQWSEALKTGMSLRDLATVLLSSSEAQAHLGAPDNATFVAELYQTTLHRGADALGAQTWVDALDHGASRADVLLAFAFSTENVSSLQLAFDTGIFTPDRQASDVARLYYGVLDRAPDAGGLAGFTDLVEHGTSLAQVAQGMLDSFEFRTAHANLSNADFIDLIYENALGRSPDEGGLTGWTAALTNGALRAEVAVGIAESLEAHLHLLPKVEAGWHLAG
ncbi:tandem-95 repeat protein [Methylobacterium sp. WL12]|nr:tandem-95 repeat protein [Methylobacterium sp. WL12]